MFIIYCCSRYANNIFSANSVQIFTARERSNIMNVRPYSQFFL